MSYVKEGKTRKTESYSVRRKIASLMIFRWVKIKYIIEYEWKLIRGKRERHGEYKKFFAKDSSKLHKHSFYNEGKLHGPYKVYFLNGQIEIDATYVDGKFHGRYRRWYSNGQLRIDGTQEGHYSKSYWTGVVQTWDKRGRQTGYYDGPAGKNKMVGTDKEDALEGRFRNKW